MSAFAPETPTTRPRAELRRALDDAVARVGDGRAVLLLALDLEDFRRYNAEHGYEAGDLLLERCAARLAEARGHSFALGADAFALVVEGTA
jgi:GGDEF domain-containing protein